MDIRLKETESIVDLERKGYKLIQDKEKFCFGMDAVLLSWFAKAKSDEKVIDLGTGTGIIPILMEARDKGESFKALEIQEESVDMARRSVELNHIQDKIEIINGDIKEATQIFGKASFNVVTSNPPYMTEKHGIENPKSAKAIARHEILCDLEDVISNAAGLLKPRGRFYMVHRPRRLVDIIELMRKYRLEPKRIRMVHPYEDKDANMVLVEGVRGSKPMMVVEAPLIVYKKNGEYQEEIHDIYGF